MPKEFHSRHEVAKFSIADSFVGELFKPGGAIDDGYGDGERKTEFGLERIHWLVVNQRESGVGIEGDTDGFNPLGPQSIALAQSQQKIEGWMEYAGARIKFYPDARMGKEKRISKAQALAVDAIATGGAKKSHRIIEYIFRRGKTAGREFSGEEAVFRGVSGV